jgi:DNA repair photolyase
MQVKENAPGLLRKALTGLPVDVVMTGDYQAAEKMEQIAKAGILTGISMMPILPGLCDTDENLEATVHWTAEHSGQFVLAGGLTLADQQREYFFGVLRDRFPDLVPLYERLYPAGSYGPVRSGDLHQIGRRVRELCQQEVYITNA